MVVRETVGDGDSAKMKLSYYDNGSWDGVEFYNGDRFDIIDVDGNYVYYLLNSSIYRLDILSKQSTLLNSNLENTLSFSNTQAMKFDVDGNYVYILNGYAVDTQTVYYTERIDMNTANPENVFIGQFVAGEQPVEDEE